MLTPLLCLGLCAHSWMHAANGSCEWRAFRGQTLLAIVTDDRAACGLCTVFNCARAATLEEFAHTQYRTPHATKTHCRS